MVSWGTEAGLQNQGGSVPTHEACFGQPSKSLHDFDGISKLCRALQLGLGGVRWWQVAITGQPVLGHPKVQIKPEGRRMELSLLTSIL